MKQKIQGKYMHSLLITDDKTKEQLKRAKDFPHKGKRYQSRGLQDEQDLVLIEDKAVGDGQHLYMERNQSQITEDFLNRNVQSLTKSLFGGATPITGADALLRNS